MNPVRSPVAAGRFYPADPRELAALVDRLLEEAGQPPLTTGGVRALVVPHAGYAYSGVVAAAAFAAVASEAGGLPVVLLGPSHFVPLRGSAVTEADAWETPLGPVPVDRELRAAALEAGAVASERPHRDDHALEVELPFLQRRVGRELRIVPIAVGTGAGAAELVAALAPDALVVVSSDLSHYHEDAVARRLDGRTAQAVVELDAAAIGDRDACGVHALRALVRNARRDGWTGTRLDLRTSADADGDSGNVVGYGAFAFTRSER